MDTKELEYPVLSTRMERFWFALLVLTFVLEGLWVLFKGNAET